MIRLTVIPVVAFSLLDLTADDVDSSLARIFGGNSVMDVGSAFNMPHRSCPFSV